MSTEELHALKRRVKDLENQVISLNRKFANLLEVLQVAPNMVTDSEVIHTDYFQGLENAVDEDEIENELQKLEDAALKQWEEREHEIKRPKESQY